MEILALGGFGEFYKKLISFCFAPKKHMPGSISIPFDAVLDPKTKAFLSPEELNRVLEAHGVKKGENIVSSCEQYPSLWHCYHTLF